VSALDRLPPWATTGVGSLPFADAESAVAHVATAYEVPFCPQLPRLDGDMISEWLGGDPGRCGWSPDRDRERPRAWEAFLGRLAASPPAHRVVKLQVTGPATLACALGRETSRRPEALALARELAVWLAANVAEQVRTLRARGLDALLVVDEPALHIFGPAGAETVWDPLRAAAPAWGLHLCGPVPWATVTRAEPDVLSFDLALGPLDHVAVRALRHRLAHGGRVAWGVVAPHRPEHAPHALERLRTARSLVREDDGAQSLLTPSCGSGRMTPDREAGIATALQDTAQAVRSPAATV
jgi:hypothetical protein